MYQLFEQEFGRPLSSIEFQRIGQWLEEDHYQPEILKLALREAVLNQAYSFNYVDRILLSWERKIYVQNNKWKKTKTKKTAASSKRSRTVSSTRRIAESLTEKLVGGVAEYVKQTKTMEALETMYGMFPEAHGELKHNNPFELLIAVILSAQATDVSVNKATPDLFASFPTPMR